MKILLSLYSSSYCFGKAAQLSRYISRRTKDGEKDSLIAIGLIVDKSFSKMLVDEILTEDVALSHCKYAETIWECKEK